MCICGAGSIKKFVRVKENLSKALVNHNQDLNLCPLQIKDLSSGFYPSGQ